MTTLIACGLGVAIAALGAVTATGTASTTGAVGGSGAGAGLKRDRSGAGSAFVADAPGAKRVAESAGCALTVGVSSLRVNHQPTIIAMIAIAATTKGMRRFLPESVTVHSRGKPWLQTDGTNALPAAPVPTSASPVVYRRLYAGGNPCGALPVDGAAAPSLAR
jgi:hypothetical protein